MAELIRRFARSVPSLFAFVLVPLAAWYLFPDLLLKYIATVLDAFAGLKAWLTPPVLFLLMNVVVLALAFTSGFLKHSQHWGHDGELEDLTKIGKRNADVAEEERKGEGFAKDDEEEDNFYPEVFSSFFGDGVTISRKKPVLQRSASAPLVERRGRSFYPSISGSFSQTLNPSPSLHASPQSATTVSSQPLLKVLRPSHTVPKTSAFELKKPLSAIQAADGNGDDKDVDQRADAFIGDFYKKMKLQQVDPYMERLERSYGN